MLFWCRLVAVTLVNFCPRLCLWLFFSQWQSLPIEDSTFDMKEIAITPLWTHAHAMRFLPLLNFKSEGRLRFLNSQVLMYALPLLSWCYQGTYYICLNLDGECLQSSEASQNLQASMLAMWHPWMLAEAWISCCDLNHEFTPRWLWSFGDSDL